MALAACPLCFSRWKDDERDSGKLRASGKLPAFIGHKRSAIATHGITERVAGMLGNLPSSERTQTKDAVYQQLLGDAKRRMKELGEEGFPQEWDVQLVRYGEADRGRKVVILTPVFLTPYLDDPEAMDHAFEFILLKLDPIAMHHQYIFVYACMGLDWTHPELVKRMRLAFDILPRRYGRNLRKFLVLHANVGFQMSSWLFIPKMDRRLTGKILYVSTIQDVLEVAYPSDDSSTREDLRRKFPFVTHRKDAVEKHEKPPVTFGIPLRQLCSYYGVDFLDVGTGKYFRHLPPSVVLVCEVLQREGGDADFYALFESDVGGKVVYHLVETLDHGMPLERDLPCSTLWCGLKLMLDCMPQPLLTFQCFDEMKKRFFRPGEREAMKAFLMEIFRSHLPLEHAYVALYVAMFLKGMCRLAAAKKDDMKHLHAAATRIQARVRRSLLEKKGQHRRRKHKPASAVQLTPSMAATVFAPSFLRPRNMDAANLAMVPVIRELVEVLIMSAAEPEFWAGRPSAPPKMESGREDQATGDSSSSSSSSSDEEKQ